MFKKVEIEIISFDFDHKNSVVNLFLLWVTSRVEEMLITFDTLRHQILEID